MTMPCKDKWLKAGLALLSAITALYIAEFSARKWFLSDFLPDTEDEFREVIASRWPHEVSVQKPPGVFRILALADSHGVVLGKDNFLYKLEDQLRRSFETVELINLSMPAVELYEERILYQRFGRTYKPDVVLHIIYVGNDLAPHTHEPRALRGNPVYLSKGLPMRPRDFALAHLLLAGYRIWSNRRKLEQEPNPGKPGTEQATLSEEYFYYVGWRMSQFFYVPAWQKGRFQPALEILKGLIQDIRRDGARYLMVILPSQLQLDRSYWAEVKKRYHLNPGDYDLDLPHRQLKALADELKVPCLDLYPLLSRLPDSASLFLVRDTHYNEKGQVILASAIKTFLEKHLKHLR